MKTVTLDTNFNSKLDCQVIIHISFAPKEGVPESRLREEVMRMETKDESHTPIYCRLIDLRRCPLIDLCWIDTFASYGLNGNDFTDWWTKKYPSSDASTLMAVYVYQRLNDEEIEMLQEEKVQELELNFN